MADNLLDKASILLTPTAYNNGSMLSVKPTDGDGDFTFVRGSAATRVNAQGLVEEVTDTNLPRINYEGFSYDGNGDIIPNSGCGSWLLEPQSTNLYLNSETLVTQSNATSASTYTVSFYGSGSITFSGTHIGSLVGNGSDERVSVTFTATSGTLTSTIIGNVNKGQLEEQSFATSYIPTEAATNTRNQDIANNSGNSSLINSTEGVLYAEIAALANDGGNRIISLSTGSQSNRLIMLYTSISNEVRALGSRNSLGQFDISFVTANALDFLKIAVKYKENDFALWVNGSEVATSNIGLTPIGLSELAFDNGGNGSAKFFGKTKCLAVYKEALTDAELQSLTTI